MAVTSLDFSFSTVQLCNHDPGFVLMDRQSIDLNKHAIDLNEVPVNDFNLDIYDASVAHGVGSSLLPKKGGWLELFRNMFGHDKAALDGYLFAACASSSGNNNVSLVNGKTHTDSRIYNTQAVFNGNTGSSVDRNPDMAQQNVASKLGSPFQHGKHRRTSKLPIFEEFNHGNSISAPRINKHAGMSDKLPYNAASGQYGFEKEFLSSVCSSHTQLNCSRGAGQHSLDLSGKHPYSNGLHAPFNLVLGQQASMGSSISPSLKPHLPSWDLNSQPGSSWSSPDLHKVGLSKSGCHQISQHPGENSFSAEAQMMQNVEGLCALPTSSRQDDGFSEREKDHRALSPLKKDSFLLSQKKTRYGSYRANVSESDQGDKLPFVEGKGFDQRIRIIASPDWLPAGWITEVKTRMAGSTAGSTDKYYKDPVTGRRFRSKNEVLSFLQTGRVCRNKPQARFLDGFPNFTNMPLLLPLQEQRECRNEGQARLLEGFPNVTDMPSLLSMQEQRVCRNKSQARLLECLPCDSNLPPLLPMQEQRVGLCDGFQGVATKHTCLMPAMDLSSQASICHNIYPPNDIGDIISVKQELEDMAQGGVKSCKDNRASDVTALAESSTHNVWERCGLEVPEINTSDPSVRTDRPPIRTDAHVRNDSTSGRPSYEPVHSNKRKALDESRCSRLPSKFLRSKVEELRNQGKWMFCMSPFHREAEAPAVSSGLGRMDPGLPYKKEAIEAQDTAVSEYLAARERPINGKAFGLAMAPLTSSTLQVKGGCVKESHMTSGPFYKDGARKAPKLTLKQERDLCITLGRKLCREFLASSARE